MCVCVCVCVCVRVFFFGGGSSICSTLTPHCTHWAQVQPSKDFTSCNSWRQILRHLGVTAPAPPLAPAKEEEGDEDEDWESTDWEDEDEHCDLEQGPSPAGGTATAAGGGGGGILLVRTKSAEERRRRRIADAEAARENAVATRATRSLIEVQQESEPPPPPSPHHDSRDSLRNRPSLSVFQHTHWPVVCVQSTPRAGALMLGSAATSARAVRPHGRFGSTSGRAVPAGERSKERPRPPSRTACGSCCAGTCAP